MSAPHGPKARSRGLDLTLFGLMLALAVACLWGAGIFDSAIEKDVRVSNVYVEDGVAVDEHAVEEVVGNRHLVIVYLDGELGERGGEVCDDVESVAEGSIVAIVDESLDMYGCALIPGRDDENLGKAYVAESVLGYGVEALERDPQEAAKVMVSNFDTLIAAGLAPQEARAIDPPFSRFIIAGIAIALVVLGALVMHLRGRRVAHLQAEALERRAAARGRLAERDTALASAGTRILELDEKYRQTKALGKKDISSQDTRFMLEYGRAITKYTELNARAIDHEPDEAELQEQLDEIEKLSRTLARL